MFRAQSRSLCLHGLLGCCCFGVVVDQLFELMVSRHVHIDHQFRDYMGETRLWCIYAFKNYSCSRQVYWVIYEYQPGIAHVTYSSHLGDAQAPSDQVSLYYPIFYCFQFSIWVGR